jgi:hypothetical protein
MLRRISHHTHFGDQAHNIQGRKFVARLAVVKVIIKYMLVITEDGNGDHPTDGANQTGQCQLVAGAGNSFTPAPAET